MSRRACALRAGRRLQADAGELRAAWEPREGGRLVLGGGGVLASFDVRVSGRVGAEPVDLRQSLDVQPTLLPLEEGPERVGVRSLWSLADADGTGFGEAMQDVFVTRHGEVFLALALRVVTRAPLVVERAGMHLELEGFATGSAGEREIVARSGDLTLLVRQPPQSARRNETLLWQQPHAPFYERWPPLFDQWSLDPATFGWTRFPGAGGSVSAPDADGRATAQIAWIDRAQVEATPQLDLRGLVWIGLGADDAVRRLADAHERPLEPAVTGGRLRGYEELDGAYEIAVAGGDECDVEFPPDPLARPLRVRVFGLDARAGIDADGELLLLSERGRPDDPLVWVDVPPEGRADEALIAATASPREPTRVGLRSRDGLHLAYQRRDPRRRLTVHHPADTGRPIATIDLSALHLVDLRLPGSERAAIHDMPLFWMRYLPKAAAHLADRLTSFEIAESSPDLVALVVESATPDGLVRSRYRLELPFRPDSLEVRLRAELEGAASWGIPTFEFADVFPENGIDPGRWEYDRIAFVGDDGVVEIDTRRPFPSLAGKVSFPAHVLDVAPVRADLQECAPWTFGRAGSVVFGGSARGTIVATASNPQPELLEHVATLCEHWCDVHFDVAALGQRPEASEASARRDAPQEQDVPDSIVAELTLRVLDPERVPFDAAVEEARAAPASAARSCDARTGSCSLEGTRL